MCVIVGITDKGDVLLVPICGAVPRGDRICVIKPGDGWPWVTKESIADYDKAKCAAKKGLDLALAEKKIELMPVPGKIFDRIIKGLDITTDLPDFWKEKRARLK